MNINEIKLTPADKGKLKKVRQYLETAYKSGYITGVTMSDKLLVEEMYSKYNMGEKLSVGCSKCCLQMFTRVGQVYFNELNYKEDK